MPAVERNAAVATCMYVCAVMTDALTAHDPALAVEVPTAMRTSAVVLVATLASPPIRNWMAAWQRAANAVLVAAVALVGWHEQGAGSRVADALFVMLSWGACVAVFLTGGIENAGVTTVKDLLRVDAPPTVSKHASATLRRESLVALVTASMLYTGTRVLRAGLRHPDAVRTFAVTRTTYNGTSTTELGYAHASATGAASLCAGGAAAIGTALQLGIVDPSTRLRDDGVTDVLVLVASAVVQAVAAFVATVSTSDVFVALPAVWSGGACGSRAVCPAAFVSRRFAVVNQSSAALWYSVLGTLVLAFAPSLRLRTRAESNAAGKDLATVVYVVTGVCLAVATSFSYLAFTGGEAVTDVAVVGALAGVAVGTLFDGVAGGVIYYVFVAADVFLLWSAHGAKAVFGHFTHCSSFTMMLIFLAYAVVTVLTDVFWARLPRAFVDAADVVTGSLAVAGTSIAGGLFVLTSALYASYDGQIFTESQLRGADNRYARSAAIFVVEHWLPLLVWLPIYACRCEVEQLDDVTRLVTWYVAPLVPVLMLVVGVASLQIAFEASLWYVSGSFVVAVVSGGLLPWALLAWV